MKGLNSRIIKVPVFRTKIEEEEINLLVLIEKKWLGKLVKN